MLNMATLPELASLKTQTIKTVIAAVAKAKSIFFSISDSLEKVSYLATENASGYARLLFLQLISVAVTRIEMD